MSEVINEMHRVLELPKSLNIKEGAGFRAKKR